MKNLCVLIIVALLALGTIQELAAENDAAAFDFPKGIKFKLLKNGVIGGSCQLLYEKETDKDGISLLKLKNFEGLGYTSQEWLASYIFKEDASIYANFIMKGKRGKPVSEIRLINKDGFDGKPGKIFRHKDLESDNAMETEIFAKHMVVDLVSMLYVTAQKVASGRKGAEKFNFLIDRSTRIVDMLQTGTEDVPFGGKTVTAQVFSFTYQNREIFRVKIFKDSDGFCFPVSVIIVTDFEGRGQTLEMRASAVSKK